MDGEGPTVEMHAKPPCHIRKSVNFMTSSFTSRATNNHRFYKYVVQGSYGHGKSRKLMEFENPFSRPFFVLIYALLLHKSLEYPSFS